MHDLVWTHFTDVVPFVQIIRAFEACNLLNNVWADSFKFSAFLLEHLVEISELLVSVLGVLHASHALFAVEVIKDILQLFRVIHCQLDLCFHFRLNKLWIETLSLPVFHECFLEHK